VRSANAALAGIVSTLVMALLGWGYGFVPALAVTLDPGAGVWNAAADGRGVRSRTVRLDGMRTAATVAFDSAGVPVVHAASDHDLFLVQGYLQAYFRITQLDLSRRTARGRLAEI
jgi:penicillin amidase